MASRKDKKGYALQKGEYQRADGRYVYAYVDRLGKRHFVYAKSLVELRQKQKNIQRDYFDGLDPCMAATIEVNHMVENYLNQKRNLRLVVAMGPFIFPMINPVITKKTGEYQTEESCLSLDGVRPCTRYKEIEVDYLDQEFKPKHGKYSGFTAQIIQHEIAHFSGELI